jgi:hypothetical protein
MSINPLYFYGNHIVSKFFSAQASQAECERIVSSVGRITTDARNRLSCFHINELSCFHNRLMKDVANKTLAALCRDSKRAKVTERFACWSKHFIIASL